MTHDPLQPLTPEEGGLHGDIPDTPEARAWFQELGEKAQTATHDPMCLLSHPCDVVCCDDDGRHRYSQDNFVKCACCEVVCECDFIAKVRADEAPKAVTRWIEQGASSDDWMKVWQVRDYAEELEAKVRADERKQASLRVKSLPSGANLSVAAAAAAGDADAGVRW